jgi:hypothetical protein
VLPALQNQASNDTSFLATSYIDVHEWEADLKSEKEGYWLVEVYWLVRLPLFKYTYGPGLDYFTKI